MPIKFSTLCITLLALLLGGCATHIPMDKQVGSTHFEYKLPDPQPKSDKVIALVSPIYVNERKVIAPSPMTLHPQVMNIHQLQTGSQVNIQTDFNTRFSNQYARGLKAALETSLAELLINRVFRVMGPYATFDDIPYSDKKKIYLASIPSITLDINRKIKSSRRGALASTETGEIQVSGTFTFKLVEPLTQQAFMTKRINLTDFAIRKDYEYGRQHTTYISDIIGMSIAKAQAPKKLTDSTDLALAEALNEFYIKSMGKLDTYISQEEILSFAPDVTEVKDLKRF